MTRPRRIDYDPIDEAITDMIEYRSTESLVDIAHRFDVSEYVVNRRKHILFPHVNLKERGNTKGREEIEFRFIPPEEKFQRLIKHKAKELQMPESWIIGTWLKGPAGKQAMEQMP